MNSLIFEELTEFIRHFSGLCPEKVITQATLFEKDLGITGDDGVELLNAIENHFNVCLIVAGLRSNLGLGPNEYLFDGEGFGFSLWWFGPGRKPVVHPFTVGELYEAICRRKTTPSVSTQNSDPDTTV